MTTQFATLDKTSKQNRGFYVPTFQIKIEGAGLPHDVLRDVIEVVYKDDIDELDSFEISVSNWYHQRNEFKYIGAEIVSASESASSSSSASTSASGGASGGASSNGGGVALLDESGDPVPNFDVQRHALFEPCNKDVELSLGYVGNAELPLIVKGNFTTMEPSFSEGGPALLSIRGINKLHTLRRKKYTDGWPKRAGQTTTDSEIVEEIAEANDPDTNESRFPLPIVTNPVNEPPIDFIGQKNEYDIDFLWKRAKERGYVVAVRINEQSNQEELYFGPSNSISNPVNYKLEWGKSLVSFTPTITNANQYRSVTVNGWDRRRQTRISVTVSIDDEEVREINPDLHGFICDAREEHVVDEPVFTEDQARQRAIAILTEELKQMVKARGTTVGLPNLRAGSKVEIGGLGGRINGVYFVTRTTHTINDSGYVTQFEARREQPPTGNSNTTNNNTQ